MRVPFGLPGGENGKEDLYPFVSACVRKLNAKFVIKWIDEWFIFVALKYMAIILTDQRNAIVWQTPH